MATTAGRLRSRGLRGWAAAAAVALGTALAALGSCLPAGTPADPPGAPPAPVSPEPEVRVGLVVGGGSVTVAGDAGLLVTGPDGGFLARVPPGEAWRVVPTAQGLALAGPSGAVSSAGQALALTPGPGALIQVNGRPYRGGADVLRDRTGLTLVNRVPLEEYLLGVVSAEMGRRSRAEQEALRAQAVASRTYAYRHLGRWRAQGFDLYATVADQVYGGVGAETTEGWEAVQSTRGLVLTYGGGVIDAFYYSTCGGRTAEATEAFRDAARPYLRSISDVDGNGIAYCSISPRYRWREEWSGESLRATLRRTLPGVLGVSGERVREVSDLRVASRTGSGRVGQLAIGLRSGELQVPGASVRQVLRSPSGELLRSAAFTLDVARSGGRIARVVADGAGAGHGVGMCQWGAVGRARTGYRYDEILAAYYPGATLQRLY